MKKILSLLLCLFILFSFAIVPCYCAEINGFYSYDMSHSAFTFENVNNVLQRVDYTDKLTVSSGTYLGEACTNLTIPFDTVNSLRYVSSFHIENLSASHEYNLKFKSSCSVLTSVGSTMCGVYLVFYNGNEILKEQELGTCGFNSLGWQSVDFDFKPDASGLGGYKTRLEFRFVSTTSSAVIYRLSDIIEFTDKDDNSSWFEKIINAIKELPSNFVNGVKGFFDNLGNKIIEVKDSISTFFNSLFAKISELSYNISGFFTSLGDRIKVFFTDLGNTLIDGLKYLFIPCDDYFSNSFRDLMDYFETKFGLFALPFTLIIKLLELFNNVGNGSGQIYLLPFEINGDFLWKSQTINLKELIMNFNSVFLSKYNFNLYEVYLAAIDVIIIIGFSRLVKRKYNSMFDTGYFDPPETIYKGDSK